MTTRVPLTEVGRRGRMDLVFALQDGRTVLRNAYCEVPFKVTRVLSSDSPLAHVILMHSTAGLFGGDDLECTIRVETGARVRLTQQSAAKIHPSEDRVALQRTRVVVESGAELELHLEALIPFAESRLSQQTHLEVESGGRLSYWEGFMTGRAGRGESWKFHELASETRLNVGGKLIYLDRFRIVPGEMPHSPPFSPWTMDTADYTGIGLHVSGDAREFASRLRESIPDAGVDTLDGNTALVRVVAPSGPEFHRCRDMFCTL